MADTRKQLLMLRAYLEEKNAPKAAVDEAMLNAAWLLEESPLSGDFIVLGFTRDKSGFHLNLRRGLRRDVLLLISEKSRGLKLEVHGGIGAHLDAHPELRRELDSATKGLAEGTDKEGKYPRIYLSAKPVNADPQGLRDALCRFVEVSAGFEASGSAPGMRRRRRAAEDQQETVSPPSTRQPHPDAPAEGATVAVDDPATVSDDDPLMESAADATHPAAVEGRERLRMHISRERSRTLRRDKVRDVRQRDGSMACEVCGFDFAAAWPSIGQDYCEVHHLRPVSSLRADDNRVSLDDLSVLCANCHRMAHRENPPIPLDRLRGILKGTS